MKIRIECSVGPKGEERPIKFWLGEGALFVESIEDQWAGAEAEYFRVRADDGNTYVLGHNEKTEEWVLESFRSHESSGTFDPHLEPPSKVH